MHQVTRRLLLFILLGVCLVAFRQFLPGPRSAERQGLRLSRSHPASHRVSPAPIDGIAPPQFSVGHGFYDAPFTLALSSATSGVVIRYTTDGSLPSSPGALVYAGPISIENTTVVRAAAEKAGLARAELLPKRTFSPAA